MNRPSRIGPKDLGAGGERVFDRPIQQAHVVLGTNGYSLRQEERFPLMLLNTLLGDGMSSRLFQNIREKYGFAYSVYSFANLLSDSGSVGAYIGTDTLHIEKCVDLVWKEFDRLRRSSISKRDVQRTKAQLKGNMMLSLENIPNRMIRLGSSELYYGEQASLDWVIGKIDAVTPEHIHDLAKNLFRRDRFCTVILKPNGKAAVSEN
jgi:predicted Zn-dependent peptidase